MNFHQLAADRRPKAYTLGESHAGGIKFLEQVECPRPDLVLHAKTTIRDPNYEVAMLVNLCAYLNRLPLRRERNRVVDHMRQYLQFLSEIVAQFRQLIHGRDHNPLIRGRNNADSLANQVRYRHHIILQPEITAFEPRPDHWHFARRSGLRIRHRGQWFLIDLYQFRRILYQHPAFGDNKRNAIADAAHPVRYQRRERRCISRRTVPQLARRIARHIAPTQRLPVRPGKYPDHAGRGLRRRHI